MPLNNAALNAMANGPGLAPTFPWLSVHTATP